MSKAAQSSKRKKAGFGLGAILLATGLVATFEGTVLHTYADPVGIPTACMGETDTEIVMRERFTLQECTALLGVSLTLHAQGVAECIHQPVQPHEAAAIISWAYNVGVGNACASTLVRLLNAGAEPREWCFQLKRWVYAGGKILRGLVRRREAEYKMCMTGEWK